MNQDPAGSFDGALHIATVLADCNGRISYFAPSAETLTGFRSGAVIGRDFKVLVATIEPLPDDAEPPDDESNEPQIHMLRTASGRTRSVYVYRHPVPQASEPVATLFLIVDSANHRESVAGLGMINAFFMQSAIGFVVLDVQLRHVMVNAAMSKINHRPIADHLGRHVNDVIESPDMDEYEETLKDVLATGQPRIDLALAGYPTTAPGLHQVRATSWFRMTDHNQNPIGLCGAVTDISSTEKVTLDAARSRAKLSLLSDVGAKLGTTLDLQENVQDLIDVLTNEYCDLVIVDVANDILATGTVPDTPNEDTLLTRLGAGARSLGEETATLLSDKSPKLAGDTEVSLRTLISNQPQLLLAPELAHVPELERNESFLAAAHSVGLNSVVSAPLRARNTTLGVLTCVRVGERQPFDKDDTLVLAEVANRTALSIDNSRLYRNEKQTAMTLQLSLLPQQLPELPEVGLTYRYQANRIDLRAGGDWFDTIELPGRRVALVVGDVAGHGIGPAAAMGHFRTAVRSLASIGMDPAALLTRLNDLSSSFGDNVTATCIYVMYDPLQHWCVMASAGHPPPILSLPGSPAEARDIAGGPLLGAIPDAEYRASSLASPPGTRLLLYTDGVVESRNSSFDDGLVNLVRRVQSGRLPDQLCDQIMSDSPSTEDDRTVLLAELRGLNPYAMRNTG